MDLNPLQLIIGPVERLLDKFIPDADERAKLAHEIATLATRQAHDNAMAQIEVNKESAKSGSKFVAGARPAAIWVCVIALFNNYVMAPYVNLLFRYLGATYQEQVTMETGEVVSKTILVQIPTLDTGELMPLLIGLLGLGAARTYEKIQGKARTHVGG